MVTACETSEGVASAAGAGGVAELRSVKRVMELPTVDAAVHSAGHLYTRVKGSHGLVEWAFQTAEAGAAAAARGAAPYVAPYVATYVSPYVAPADARAAAALEALERAVPLVKLPPQELLDAARLALAAQLDKVYAARSAAVASAASLQELSRRAARDVVASQYGRAARTLLESAPPAALAALHGADAAARRLLLELRADPLHYLVALLAALHLTATPAPPSTTTATTTTPVATAPAAATTGDVTTEPAAPLPTTAPTSTATTEAAPSTSPTQSSSPSTADH